MIRVIGILCGVKVVIRDTRFLKKYFWRYLAVDEGHRLKNHKCLLVKCLSSFSSTNRVILTGTPLQNNLSELWALLNFLLPDIFDNLDVFESWFEINDMMEEGSEQKIVQQEKEKQILSTLHKILNPFLLRRVKTDVDLQIPLKKELIVYTPMTQLQKVRKDLTSLLKYESDSDDETFDNFLDKALEKEIHIEKMVKIIKNSEDNFNIRNIMICGKLQVLDQVLEELKKRNHKVLIFSQMTKLLDIIEDYLYLRPQYKYKRLDGRVKLEDRQVDIDEFNNGNDYYIYLLSTRAGGLGINLTSADTVIIYDSDWNPQQDLQAQDRCHRIGQTKPVLILRLVTASTVDQEMVERATAKRKLEKMVMKKGAFISLRKIDENIDPEELLKLLQSRDSNRIYRASTGSGIFTKEELDQLLDRSELMRDDGESSSVMKEVKGIFKTITNVMK
ncbi:Lymphoid-specific helicase [Armadillidium vulgare]|nr:Lymphoid-specific helicase [Armadillidium vulgare]